MNVGNPNVLNQESAEIKTFAGSGFQRVQTFGPKVLYQTCQKSEYIYIWILKIQALSLHCLKTERFSSEKSVIQTILSHLSFYRLDFKHQKSKGVRISDVACIV